MNINLVYIYWSKLPEYLEFVSFWDLWVIMYLPYILFLQNPVQPVNDLFNLPGRETRMLQR